MPRAKRKLAMVDSARPDAETRATTDHHDSLRLWLRLLACTQRIEASVRFGLQSMFQTTLPRFDLMAQLDRVPEGLKMIELSHRMMVSGGNITMITDQLEKEGLVVRDADPEDRRVYRVKLTKEGRRAFRRMATEHEEWIIELFDVLSVTEKQTLSELLGRLKRHVSIARPARGPGK